MGLYFQDRNGMVNYCQAVYTFKICQGGIEMDEFFNRSPEKVAQDLIGKTIKVGQEHGVILKATPQTRKDNQRWLNSKPLFGDNPVDFYVSKYRAALLPFLRTAPDTCVRIDSINIKGKVFEKPTHVCQALGIDAEATGDITFGGKTITIKLHKTKKDR